MSRPKYWRGIEELEQSPEFIAQKDREFSTDIPMEDALSNTTEESLGFNANRRDFLKVMGFGMTAATLSACSVADSELLLSLLTKPVVNNIQQIMIDLGDTNSILGFFFISLV